MSERPIEAVNAACPVCGARSINVALIASNTHGRHVVNGAEKFHIFRCVTCDALFVGGVHVDQAFYERYYDSTYYDPAPPKGLVWASRPAALLARWSTARKAGICRQALARPARPIRLLDFGCGAGDFLASLDQAVFAAEGVEINSVGRAACTAKGVRVRDSLPAISAAGEHGFDVITMWHVLEHLPDPREVLLSLRRLLRPGGVIVIAVPNHRCLGFRLGAGDWFHLDSPRHLFIPSRRTLEYLASESALKVQACHSEWYDYPLDLWWSVRNSSWRWVVWPLYPLLKRVTAETCLFVLKES